METNDLGEMMGCGYRVSVSVPTLPTRFDFMGGNNEDGAANHLDADVQVHITAKKNLSPRARVRHHGHAARVPSLPQPAVRSAEV